MCENCPQASFDIVQMVDQRECYLIWCVGVAGSHPILGSPPQNTHTHTHTSVQYNKTYVLGSTEETSFPLYDQDVINLYGG